MNRIGLAKYKRVVLFKRSSSQKEGTCFSFAVFTVLNQMLNNIAKEIEIGAKTLEKN